MSSDKKLWLINCIVWIISTITSLWAYFHNQEISWLCVALSSFVISHMSFDNFFKKEN